MKEIDMGNEIQRMGIASQIKTVRQFHNTNHFIKCIGNCEKQYGVGKVVAGT